MRRVLPTLTLVLMASVLVSYGQLQPSASSGWVNDYKTSVSLAAGQTVTLTSLTAPQKKLSGFEVWSSVRYKAFAYTLANGVESTNPVVIGGAAAFETYQWKSPALDYIVLGNSGGVDAFEMKITNLDTINAADVYCVFHYSN